MFNPKKENTLATVGEMIWLATDLFSWIHGIFKKNFEFANLHKPAKPGRQENGDFPCPTMKLPKF